MAIPPITARIVADDRDLQRGLERSKTAMQRFASVAGTAMAALGRMIGPIGVAGAVLGLTKALQGSRQAMADLDATAKRAQTAGLNPEFFQVLQFAAEEAGVGQEKLNSSLLAFVKRMGEAQAGAGPLINTFKKLRPELLESLKAATSQEQALRILADAISTTTSAQEAAALASAAFSRGGIELVRVLKQGSAGFDETAARAKSLGAILRDDLFPEAENLENRYGVATMRITAAWRKFVIQLAPILVWIQERLADLAQLASNFATSVVDSVSRIFTRFGDASRYAEAALVPVEKQIERLKKSIERRGETPELLVRLSELEERARRLRQLNVGQLLRGTITDPDGMARFAPPPMSSNVPPFATSEGQESVGGRGAGGKGGLGSVYDYWGNRYAFIQQSLKSEEELLTEQYEKDLAFLMIYHEKKKTAEAQALAEIEALNKQHYASLAAIRTKELQAANNAILGGAAAIFGALGERNKKMLKMSKIFGAAQALVSTMVGAAEALKLGFPQNLAAAAAVVAKGIGFVNAIKSTSESGATGAAGGAGGGTSAAATPVQEPERRSTAVSIALTGGDMFSRDQVVGLINSINEALEDGARLRIA